MQSLVGANREAPEECIGTESECFVAGAIVDSWVEPARSADAGALLVLQVAPRGHPEDLVMVEAEVSLVPRTILAGGPERESLPWEHGPRDWFMVV